VDDRESEKLFERIEVSIAVQQGVLLANAKRGDETIDRFSNRVPSSAQCAIVASRISGQVHATCVEHLQLQQLALYVLCCGLITNALQDFAENHIRECKALSVDFHMKPIRCRMPDPLEVIDPDSRVDDDHAGYFANRPRREVSRLPSQVTLPRSRRMLLCARV
jgi:hypothetical protein